MKGISGRIESVEAELNTRDASRTTGSIRPWAYCPRPVFQARYINNMRADASDVDHTDMLAKTLNGLRDEIRRRPQFANDPDVLKAMQ